MDLKWLGSVIFPYNFLLGTQKKTPKKNWIFQCHAFWSSNLPFICSVSFPPNGSHLMIPAFSKHNLKVDSSLVNQWTTKKTQNNMMRTSWSWAAWLLAHFQNVFSFLEGVFKHMVCRKQGGVNISFNVFSNFGFVTLTKKTLYISKFEKILRMCDTE